MPTVNVDTPDAPGRLLVHDTATDRLVPVGPAAGTARMYVCGITPYDATHIGHANTYVAFDLLLRTWCDLGLGVEYAQNVTDVDDPLLERALATGQDWEQLAEEQTELFRTDMEALRVVPPNHYIGAVECVPCVSELVHSMHDTGMSYQIEDPKHPDWYFTTSAVPTFGAVSNLDRDTMLTRFAEMGGDPERAGKKDALDSLLWQMARPDEPAWDSPLGRGRPGWHIECTAIALKYLGSAFDVQGGGSDLVFPHHEMSAAQGVAASGEAFAQTYVHSGMVGLDGKKMSKSLGNLELVSRLRAAGTESAAIRLALLAHHYRDDWEWTTDGLRRAEERLDLWRRATRLDAAQPAVDVVTRFRAAMRNDLDAPAALGEIDAWAAASIDVDGDDTDAPAQITATVDALLGISLG